MKSMNMLIVLSLLGAPAAVLAQSAQTAPIGTGTDVGRTGTDSATATTGTSTDVGRTGTDSMLAAAPAPLLPMTLAVKSSAITSPGSNTATALMAADQGSTSDATASYTVPVSSSDAACTVPESVTLQWSSSAGAMSSFAVDCAAVSSNRTVTITAGNASTSFTLKR